MSQPNNADFRQREVTLRILLAKKYETKKNKILDNNWLGVFCLNCPRVLKFDMHFNPEENMFVETPTLIGAMFKVFFYRPIC
jgi:hypothetical protein